MNAVLFLYHADKRNAFDIAKYLSGGYEVKENEPARTFVVDGAEDDLHELRAQHPDDEMP